MTPGATTRGTRSFSPALFGFLRELAANNDRDWFSANKERYERDVREPALQFIVEFAPYLAKVSPHFLAEARPVGGSLFRIQRDVRFSRDKTPYKTSVGIQFRHERGKDAHTPGFYLHLEPGAVWGAAGVWRPDGASLTRIRAAIDADPAGWRRAVNGKAFSAAYRLDGESLKRPPARYSADHPLIDDLKRKDFIATTRLDERDAIRGGFIDEFAANCKLAKPLVAFLCRALELPF